MTWLTTASRFLETYESNRTNWQREELALRWPILVHLCSQAVTLLGVKGATSRWDLTMTILRSAGAINYIHEYYYFKTTASLFAYAPQVRSQARRGYLSHTSYIGRGIGRGTAECLARIYC